MYVFNWVMCHLSNDSRLGLDNDLHNVVINRLWDQINSIQLEGGKTSLIIQSII